MKSKEGERIWMDDNGVDFSRKERTCRNNSKVSSHYSMFDPEDMTLDSADWECNPSVNKETWPLSEEFEEELNSKSHLLNKGKSRLLDEAFERGRDLNRFFGRPEVAEIVEDDDDY